MTRGVKIRIGMMTVALVWLAAACAQSQREFDLLRQRLDAHMLNAEARNALLSEIERRVENIEQTSRTDRFDARLSKLEASAEGTRTLVMGIGFPVLLMGLESILRLMRSARQKATED